MTRESISWNADGLVAAIVQDVASGAVLMLGWMNEEALRRTEETGRAHFWSRSRGRLWEKGATSGSYLDVVSVAVDCDGDALLVRVRPRGPVCHTGSATCWGEPAINPWSDLADLWQVISERAAKRPAQSYTVSLLDAGAEQIGRKVVEEATEVLLAGKDHAAGEVGDTRLAEEVADLLYHLMVLVAERRLDPATVAGVLSARRG